MRRTAAHDEDEVSRASGGRRCWRVARRRAREHQGRETRDRDQPHRDRRPGVPVDTVMDQQCRRMKAPEGKPGIHLRRSPAGRRGAAFKDTRSQPPSLTNCAATHRTGPVAGCISAGSGTMVWASGSRSKAAQLQMPDSNHSRIRPNRMQAASGKAADQRFHEGRPEPVEQSTRTWWLRLQRPGEGRERKTCRSAHSARNPRIQSEGARRR